MTAPLIVLCCLALLVIFSTDVVPHPEAHTETVQGAGQPLQALKHLWGRKGARSVPSCLHPTCVRAVPPVLPHAATHAALPFQYGVNFACNNRRLPSAVAPLDCYAAYLWPNQLWLLGGLTS